VSAWYVAGGNRVLDAPYTVIHDDGSDLVTLDQRTGGTRWNVLGQFPFMAGEEGAVRLSNQASGGDVVIADAVRFLLLDAQPAFIRGDANRDGDLDLGDAVAVLYHLFRGKPVACPDAADANDSGVVDLADAVTILGRLFRGAAALPRPSETPGADPTADGLGVCK